MATGRVTKRSVEAIALPAKGKRNHLWDETLKGFGAMVTHTGVRSYLLQYRMGGRGHPSQTITIGRHGSPWTAEKAREQAADLLELVRKGVDPKASKAEKRQQEEEARRDQNEFAFATYVDTFIHRHAVKKKLRSTPDIEAVFRRDLKPRFGDRSIKALSRSDITKALDEIGDRSGSAANKAHKWLKKMFNFAVERGDLHGSPMDRMRPPHEEQSRERALDDRELRPVWLACEAIGYPFGPFTQLLLLTGQRLREVAGMRWEEFSEDAREWLIPGARTRNKQPHLLPLCELARSILLDIKARGIDSELVFTTNGRTPVSGFSKAKKRIDNYIAERPESVGVVAPWTFHDLRRTTATGCQRLGIPIDHTEALINHTGRRRGIVAVYQLYDYRLEKAVAGQRWAEKVISLVGS
ncbi:site-specific integrase [Sphingomonas sp.]|uniref:tyrosine-type recombinase/integrase n=2 Tax=Pseudomonadota TaxID=1224 RepID=UPI00286F228F|nr:site-specific integrase [Sphingomonas sp.]